MPLVRILSWNIYHFSTNRSAPPVASAHRRNIILDEVHPAANPPNYDIFVIIETKTAKPTAYANVGNLAASGPTGGLPATQQLLAALQARQAGAGGGGNWEAVVPTFLTARSQAEAISIFFHTACVTLQGPLTDLALVAGSPWRTAATQSGLGTFKGQTRFYTVPPAGGAEIWFPVNPQRRPYKVDFQTVAGGGVNFSVVAHHAPPPAAAAGNANAQRGVLQLAEIQEITVTRAAPVIIVGDFNCCTMQVCPNATKCYANDWHAQNKLTGPDSINYAHTEDALTVIRETITATTEAENATAHAAAAVVNAGNALLATVDAVNAQLAAVNVANAVGRARAAHTRVVGVHVTVTNAQAAEINITAAALPPMGALAGAYVVSAGNFANLAVAARNTALAMSDHYNANTTTFLENYADAIRHCANAIDNPAGSAADAVLTGLSAQAAMDDINGVSVPSAAGVLGITPVPNAAALILAATGIAGPVTLAQAAVANGAGDVALARAARDAIHPIAQSLYISHIQQDLSSLKGSAATPALYRNHAFDHLLTIGANRVTNAHVVDLVPAVVTAYHAPYGVGMWGPTFKAGFKYIAIWGRKGISDHLPVRADVDL